MKKKKLTTGPLGFPMLDESAQELDRLLKTLPKECKYKRAEGLPSSTEFVPGEKADVAMISTSTLDRDNECVDPRGVRVDMYLKNPVVQFSHRWEDLPIGRCEWLKKIGNGLRAKTKYADPPEDWQGDWFPSACYALVKQNILRGRSIGFLPTKIRSPTKEEITKRPELKDCQAYIEESLLLEYSLVPIPACPDAIVEAVSKGLMSERFLGRFGLKSPKPHKRKVDELALFLKGLENLDLDPEKIAEAALDKLLGKV